MNHNEHIKKAIDLAKKLIRLADSGETEEMDDGCILLFCVIRDCAYQIKTQAELEKKAHIKTGIWK
ncbi:MAG: hypothetical protein JXN60_03725 [Lentisphaerae bacterium]|nr:hypothetical protein [Lentisphaerota bacterium]